MPLELNRRYKSVYFADDAKGFLLLLLIAQLFLNNGIYLFFGGICLALLFSRLQIPFKPGVFTIIFLYHFIQSSAGVWLSNYLGEDINFKSPMAGTAMLSCYAGLFALFIPIIYFTNKIPPLSRASLLKQANNLSIEKTFQIYVIMFFIMNTLSGVAFLFTGLTQIIISLLKVKWLLFILFGYQVILKKKMYKQFYLFIAIEFILGFFTYFSDFKTVIFFIGAIYFTFITKVYLRHIIIGLIGLTLAFLMGIFWSSIKGEYRGFLNQGSKTQSVQVSKMEALNKLKELSDKQDRSTYEESIVGMLDRLQYTYHLAKAMERMPEMMPFQEGKNWGLTLEFVLTPRILNPNKPTYEASSKTSKYTGINYAGARTGTSVSLGYFADGFVDFGYIGMYIPLILLGLLYGNIYYFFLRKASPNYLFNYAVIGAFFMEYIALEMDSTYLMGRLFASIVTFTLLKFFFFPWLYGYVRSVESKVKDEKYLEAAVVRQ